MPFTVSDAIELVDSWLGENTYVRGEDALLWGNEFLQNEVDSNYWPEAQADYADAEEHVKYLLPADFVRTLSVMEKRGHVCNNYVIRGGNICFEVKGNYEFTYVAYPEKITDFEASFPLPDMFLYPLAYFITFNHTGDEKYWQLYSHNLQAIQNEAERNNMNESFQVKGGWS